MNLIEFLDMLSDLELSQVSFSNRGEDGKLIKQDALISLINRGVRDLHNRFLISKGELYFNIQNTDNYRVDLRDQNLVLTPDLDNEIIKIIQILDYKGNDVNFNIINRNSINDDAGYIEQVNKTTLIFNNCYGGYRVFFQKGAKQIDKELVDENTEIDIPVEFASALVYYVASHIHSINPLNAEYSRDLSPTIIYSKKYKEEIMDLKVLSAEISEVGNNRQRFRDSSFL